MEIEVNEYVRINKDFRITCIGIGKVVNKNKDTIYVKMPNNDLPISFNINSIAKHNKNIIDLIEVGDIVHIKDVLHEDIIHIWSEDYLKALKEDIQNGIKLVSILKKEQMKSIEYKVEEEK